MSKTGRRKSAVSTRGPLRSPGRPSRGSRAILGGDRARIVSGSRRRRGARVLGGGIRWFRHAGGMPPTQFAPAAPPLSGRYLSFAEREELALLRAQRHGVRECARQLKRSPSTISRELRWNAATRSGALDYRAITALRG